MLTLTGQVGSQLEVTFAQAFRCVVAEESINGRDAYLHRDSIKVQAGDRCRVTLVDCPESGDGFALLRVDEVIETGVGGWSLRQLTVNDIQTGWYVEKNFERTVLANLRSRCAGDNGDAKMLEVLLDVLECYSYTNRADSDRFIIPLKYGHYCIVIARLINKLYADDAAKRIELYLRAARYCAVKPGGRQWAESFRAVAGTLQAA